MGSLDKGTRKLGATKIVNGMWNRTKQYSIDHLYRCGSNSEEVSERVLLQVRYSKS